MKSILFTLTVTLLAISAWAQPQAFKYQAVARGSNGALLVNTDMNIRVSIRIGSATGNIEYQEKQHVTTNQYGLFSIDVGSGIPIVGLFNLINWANSAQKYIQTEIDLGNGFIDMGASKLLSVPFALYSLNGTPGAAGPQGPQGTVGPAGAQGVKGDMGLPGPAGATGKGITSTIDNHNGSFTFNFSDGSTFTTSNLTGPAGAKGATGIGIASTTDNHNGTFTFTYSDGSAFTTSNLTGPQGVAGAQGPAGLQGATGATGNGIKSTINNADGTYTFNYSDGTSFTTSNISSLGLKDSSAAVRIALIDTANNIRTTINNLSGSNNGKVNYTDTDEM
jgi:hypothetical protein